MALKLISQGRVKLPTGGNLVTKESPRALLHVKVKGQQIWCDSKTNG